MGAGTTRWWRWGVWAIENMPVFGTMQESWLRQDDTDLELAWKFHRALEEMEAHQGDRLLLVHTDLVGTNWVRQ